MFPFRPVVFFEFINCPFLLDYLSFMDIHVYLPFIVGVANISVQKFLYFMAFGFLILL